MPEAAIEPSEPPSTAGVPVTGLTTVRHAPRYRAFALTGGTLGLFAGALGAALAGGALTSAIALSAVVGGLLGGLLGVLVAVLVDRRSR